MTAQESESLAVLETKVDGIEATVSEIKEMLQQAIEKKADKTEVATLSKRMWGVLIAVAGGAVVLLVGMFIFVAQGHFQP